LGSRTISFDPRAQGSSISTSIENDCNQNNGCNNGWQDVGTWKQTCADSDDYSRRGAICANPNPRSLCPNIGSISSASWTTSGGIRLQCVYSQITNPFDQSAPGVFVGSTTNLTQAGGLQNQWCDTQTYTTMINGQCQGWYSSHTNDLPHQQLIRINRENPNNSWVSDSQLLSVVQGIAEGNSSWASDAVNMIVNYCMVTNPNRWPDNNAIRTIINGWAVGVNRQGNIVAQNAAHASTLINQYCAGPGATNAHCDCIIAGQLGYNGCAGKTSTACADYSAMRAVFTAAKTNSLFTAQITAIENNAMQPQCVCQSCIAAHQDIGSTYLSPTTGPAYQPCCQNITACFSSIKVGGLAPGASISASCTQNVQQTASSACPTLPALPSTVPTPPPPPPPPNPLTGNNIGQQVGGTTTVATSPVGGSVGVTNTGTTGGVVTNVTGTPGTKVGVTGPATFAPGSILPPRTAPSPATGLSNTSIAAVAGGGFLGLSSSFCFFMVVCVILFLVLGTSGSPPAAPRPIIVPTGI
jgi:hypothetical protein